MHRAPQTHYGVENGPGRVGERASVNNRNGVANFASSPQESGAIRFKFQVTNGFAFRKEHVRGPDGCLIVRSHASSCQHRPDIRNEFCLHE